MKPIVCPACGSIGYPSDEELFEIRGQLEGKPVRRCTRCGTGLFIRPLRKPQVIPHNLWVRMQEVWQAESDSPTTTSVVNEKPSELEMAGSLYERALEGEATKEQSIVYLTGGTVRMITHFCTKEGMTPMESAEATGLHLQGMGFSFESAISIIQAAGVPLSDDGRLRGDNDGPFEATPYHMTRDGWDVIRKLVLEEWNRCVDVHMTAVESITEMLSGKCGEILSVFSPESPLVVFRLSGLPADDIVDACNELGAEEEAKVVRCRCGCGEAVQPPNTAYVNRSHQSHQAS